MVERIRSRLPGWLSEGFFRRIIKNSSMLFGAQTIVMLISFVQFPIVSRWLGPENYGLWGLASSWIGFIGQLLGIRLWEVVIKYLTQFVADGDQARALAIVKLCVLTDLAVSVVIFAGLNLTADLAAHVIYRSYEGGADLIRLETLSGLAVVTSGVWVAALRVFDKFKRLSLYNVLSAIAQFALWMLVLWLQGGLGGLILTTALVRLGQTVALIVLTQRELSGRFSRHWLSADIGTLKGHRRGIAGLAFNMSADTLRKIAIGSADILILGWLGTPFQVGIYKLAKQLAGFVTSLSNPIYDSLYPEMVRVYATGGGEAVRPIAGRLMRLTFLGLSVSLTGALVASPWLVPLLFGPAYSSAVPVFSVLLFGNIWMLGIWVPSTLVAAGRARQLTLVNTFVSLIMLLALFTLIPVWGALGAAVAQVGFYGLWLALALHYARKALQAPAAAPVR